MRMTGKHIFHNKFNAPVRMRAVGVDFDNGVDKIMLPEVAKWIPPSELIEGSWERSYQRGNRTLTLENGSTCEFMSYDQDVDKFAGTSRHGVWFDEEPPEDIFNECLARLIDTKGDWWLTMTPLIDMSWTLDRLYTPGITGTNPNIEVFEVNTEENQYVSVAEIDLLTMGMTEEQKAARRAGKYMTYTGTIYGSVITDQTYIPDVFEEHDGKPATWSTYYEKWEHFGMLDHGFRNPTAFLFGCYDQEGRIVIYDEYYESNRVVDENAVGILSKIRELKLTDKMQYMVADPSIRNTDPITGTSVQQVYGENGLYFTLANNDVTSGINRVISRFKNQNLFISKRCKHLIWELGRYRWDRYASTKVTAKNNIKETPMKKDDHACDALRYGIVSRPAMLGEEELRFGNLIGAPVALVGDARYDEELQQLEAWGSNSNEESYYHPILGGDF